MKRRNFVKSQHSKQYRQADRFKNPFFKRRKSGSSVIKKLLQLGSILIVIIGIPYLIFTLNIFKIKSVSAQGLITIQPTLIEDYTWQFLTEKRLNILPQNHIWLTDEKELINRLENAFQLTDVEIVISGRKLAINASESITNAIWASDDKLYFIDADGFIIRELTLDELLDVQERVYSGVETTNFIQSDVFLIFDEKRLAVNAGDQVIAPGVIHTLQTIHNAIPSLNMEPGDFLIKEQMNDWLTLQIKHGFNIYINGAGDPEEQLKNLEIILKEYQYRISEIEYIDLRFDGRVYIK